MRNKYHQKIGIFVVSLLALTLTGLFLPTYLRAQESPTPSPSPTLTPAVSGTPAPTSQPDNSGKVQELNDKIKELEGKVNDLGAKKKSLSSEIAVMDNQIKLTELRINANENQINELEEDISTATGKITKLEGSLDKITEVLLNRIIATYQVSSVQPIQVLMGSSDVSDLVSRANYLKIAQENDKKLIYNTVQAKNDYENQKDIFEQKKQKIEILKKELLTYSEQIEKDKEAKKRLLEETQGNEATYQKILADTKAQLAGFHGFVTSQGGATILNNQTVCDDWGCYYNQRDSQWGNTPLNGTGYTLASDGCLVTSMAMIYTHYGYKDINPQSINSNSSNFGGIPAALLRFSISTNGTSSQRINADIDATLASGHPVVIGISYDSGSLADHFLVLISGSGGNYMMNDPFTPNGRNISFRDRYPSVRIVQSYRVTF